MKNTYKDFKTGKVHWTSGIFSGWTKPTGLLGAAYAIFQRPHSQLLIPEYLLTRETREKINNGTIKSV